MSQPIIKSGAHVCDGRPRYINVGFVPDIVLAKLGTGATPWMWWTRSSWVERTQRIGSQDSFFKGIMGTDPSGCFLLGDDAQANVAGETLYWLAMSGNESNTVAELGWMGNSLDNHVVAVGDAAPDAVIIKRDANRSPIFRAAPMTRSVKMDGLGAMTTAVKAINSDGTLTLGTAIEVNECSGDAIGEGHDCIAVWNLPGVVEVVSWVGDAAATRTIAHSVSNPCATIIVVDGSGTKAAFKTAEMPATFCAQTDSTGATGAVSGLLALGDATYNANGVTHYAIIFGRSDAQQVSKAMSAPSTAKAVVTRGTSNACINCGTDNSLSMAGAFSLEWWGALRPDTRGVGTTYQAIMARSSGDEGRADSDGLANAAGTRRDGTWSWGIFAYRPNDLGDWAGPQFVIPTTNYNNIFDFSGSEHNVFTKPWRTGVIVPKDLFHVIVTHDGNGKWGLYLNGKLVKQRNINMTSITLTDDAGTRVNAGAGTGHRTVFGGRQGSSSIAQLAKIVMCGASVYGSELSKSQALQMYRRHFLSDPTAEDIVPVERWLANDASGVTLPAQVNAANNGTITASAGVVSLNSWRYR